MKIHGTAKGGALSTKDFGVAFGGVPAFICDGSVIYTYTCGTNEDEIGDDYDQYAIRNQSGGDLSDICSMTWYFRKGSNTPDGTIAGKMYAADGSTVIALTNTHNAVDVTATSGIGDPLTFNFTEGITWADDYYLAVEYSGGNDKITVVNSYVNTGGCVNPSSNFKYYYYDNGSSTWNTSPYWVNMIATATT